MQSPLVWKSMQGVTLRRFMKKVADQPKSAQEQLVKDLKAVMTTVTKNTIGNTLKSCSIGTRVYFKFSIEHFDDSEYLGQSAVLR